MSQHLFLPPKCPTLTDDDGLGPVPPDVEEVEDEPAAEVDGKLGVVVVGVEVVCVDAAADVVTLVI